MSFSGMLCPMDVLMNVTGFDHFPISFVIIVGNSIDSTHSTLFKLNVSHLESIDFHALV